MNKSTNKSDIIIVSKVLVLVVIIVIASIIQLIAELLVLHDLSHIIDWLSSYGGSAKGGGYYTKGFGILIITIIFLSMLIYLIKTLKSMHKIYKSENNMSVIQSKKIR